MSQRRLSYCMTFKNMSFIVRYECLKDIFSSFARKKIVRKARNTLVKDLSYVRAIDRFLTIVYKLTRLIFRSPKCFYARSTKGGSDRSPRWQSLLFYVMNVLRRHFVRFRCLTFTRYEFSIARLVGGQSLLFYVMNVLRRHFVRFRCLTFTRYEFSIARLVGGQSLLFYVMNVLRRHFVRFRCLTFTRYEFLKDVLTCLIVWSRCVVDVKLLLSNL